MARYVGFQKFCRLRSTCKDGRSIVEEQRPPTYQHLNLPAQGILSVGYSNISRHADSARNGHHLQDLQLELWDYITMFSFFYQSFMLVVIAMEWQTQRNWQATSWNSTSFYLFCFSTHSWEATDSSPSRTRKIHRIHWACFSHHLANY